MTTISHGSLQPTWTGYVNNTREALMLFEACLNGSLHHVPRRPHDRERSSLIKSGSVFIYEENASGIKRWTDGVPWSPSRILGNFLVYRELVKPFPPGEKKRATKRPKRPSRSGEPYPRPQINGEGGGTTGPVSPITPETPTKSDGGYDQKETERALIGSLIDSYGFKEGGLVKKTMSVNVQGVHHHLVSYYTINDVKENQLSTPTEDTRVARMEPRAELITRQNFRAPIDDMDEGMQDSMDGSQQQVYPGYEFRPYDGSRTDMYSSGIPVTQHSHIPADYYSQAASNLYQHSTSMPPPNMNFRSLVSNGSFYMSQQMSPQTSLPAQTVMPHQDEHYDSRTPRYNPPIDVSTPSTRQVQHSHPQPSPQYYRTPSISATTAQPLADSAQGIHDSRSLNLPSWQHSGSVYAPTAPRMQLGQGNGVYSQPQVSNSSSTHSLNGEYTNGDHQHWPAQSPHATPLNGRHSSYSSQGPSQ